MVQILHLFVVFVSGVLLDHVSHFEGLLLFDLTLHQVLVPQFSILPSRYLCRFLDLADLFADILVLSDIKKISFIQIIVVGRHKVDPVQNEIGILLIFTKLLDVTGHVHREISHSVEGVLDNELALLFGSIVG